MHSPAPAACLVPAVLAPAVLVLLALVPVPAAAEDAPPAPRFDRVDHANPAQHLAISPAVGDAAKLAGLAAQLRGDSAAATLAAIGRWMDKNLRQDEAAGRTWRDFDSMVRERTYGSCADHAVVFGTLARAAGIPTIWVKTMDLGWIREFQGGLPGARQYRGHVFLEVHVDGRWQLLDAEAMRLYADYQPDQRLVPGDRFAYDKGDDPYALVLSCRWELWQRQTDAYFATLDPAALPWGRSVDLLEPWRVYVAGNRPLYGYAAQTARRLGYRVELTFNTDWDRVLPNVRRKVLIVTCQGTTPVLPEAWWDRLLPPGARDVARGRLPEKGWLAHRLADGTRVILVTGQDMGAIEVQVAQALRE